MLKLVIRTNCKKWQVIQMWFTGHAAETILREQHSKLDEDPLRETKRFRNARHILFVAVPDEPQVLHLVLSNGTCSIMEVETNGVNWTSSLSWIDGRGPTPGQVASRKHSIVLSPSGECRVSQPFTVGA